MWAISAIVREVGRSVGCLVTKMSSYFNGNDLNGNDSDCLVLTDENGEFLRKGKKHPDNIQLIDLSALSNVSDEDFRSETEDNNNVTLEKIVPIRKSQKAPATKNEIVDLSPKTAEIYESIADGLGILFSKEDGMVLFHVDHLYVDGHPASIAEAKSLTKTNNFRRLKYVEVIATNPSYAAVSPTNTIHQALAVWTGTDPKNLSKLADSEGFLEELKLQRQQFAQMAENKEFLELAMLRVKGKIVGHFANGRYGYIEVADDFLRGERVLFKKDDAYVFRRRVDALADISYSLPIGLIVYFDAIKVANPTRTFRDMGIEYQAVVVLAGSWPELPHPTALVVGNGTYAPRYSGRHTFFYLNRDVGWQMVLKQHDFSQTCYDLQLRRSHRSQIRSSRDYAAWHEEFSPHGCYRGNNG